MLVIKFLCRAVKFHVQILDKSSVALAQFSRFSFIIFSRKFLKGNTKYSTALFIWHFTISLCLYLTFDNEAAGLTDNVSSSYSGGTCFESRLEHPLSWLMFCFVLNSTSGRVPRLVPQTRQRQLCFTAFELFVSHAKFQRCIIRAIWSVVK
jgi:hypothetical protein